MFHSRTDKLTKHLQNVDDCKELCETTMGYLFTIRYLIAGLLYAIINLWTIYDKVSK